VSWTCSTQRDTAVGQYFSHLYSVVNTHCSLYIQCEKKSSPLKLFAIFSLGLSVFPSNFASMLPLYIHTQVWSIYPNIYQNGVNFSKSTRRF